MKFMLATLVGIASFAAALPVESEKRQFEGLALEPIPPFCTDDAGYIEPCGKKRDVEKRLFEGLLDSDPICYTDPDTGDLIPCSQTGGTIPDVGKRQFEGLQYLCTDPVTLETTRCNIKRFVEKRQFGAYCAVDADGNLIPCLGWDGQAKRDISVGEKRQICAHGEDPEDPDNWMPCFK